MIRNYSIYPAQTNLELFIQMAESGRFSDKEIEICNKAYFFSLNCVYNMVRGSGKPFISHLVGLASLLIDNGMQHDVIVASLMHAVYQRRVSFPGANSIEERRIIVRNKFGTTIEELIHEYTDFEYDKLSFLTKNDQLHPFFKEILFMHLGDELEDITYHSLFMHGLPQDSEKVRGSYLWRIKDKKEHFNSIIEFIGNYGTEKMSDSFQFWINATPYQNWSDGLKSGQYSSYNIV